MTPAGFRILFSIAFATLTSACSTSGPKRPDKPMVSIRPVGMSPERRHQGPPRRLLMRVFAEDEFRKTSEGWQVRFFKMIERASAFLHSTLGIEIEIDEMKDWPNHASFASLDGALIDLESLDRAEDVDLVVGLIAPVPMATPAFHQIGMARMLGRHLVLRGLNDAEEYQNLLKSLGAATSEERERAYEERLHHKELAIFLHELGHLLGAIHVQEPESLMFEHYDDHMRAYGPPTTDVAEITLAAFDKKKKVKRAEIAERLAAFYEKSSYGGFTGYGREKVIALLRGDPRELSRATDRDIAADGLASGGRSGEGDTQGVGPKTEAEKLKDASELAAGGKVDEAWLVLKPIAAAHPADKEIQAFACQLGAMREPKAEESLKRCAHAKELAGDAEPAPALYAAYVALQLEREEEAYPLLVEAEARIEKKKDAKPELWAFLAELYQGSHAASSAERAAKRAAEMEGGEGSATPRAKAVLDWAEKVRAAFSLDSKLSPDEERAYVLARIDVESSLRKDTLEEAEKKNQALRARFPSMPGAEVSICEAYASKRSFAKAEAMCARALKEEATAARAHAVLGLIAFQRGAMKAAVGHLEAAHAQAPEDREVWRTLIAVYRAAGRRDKANALERAYRRQFGGD